MAVLSGVEFLGCAEDGEQEALKEAVTVLSSSAAERVDFIVYKAHLNKGDVFVKVVLRVSE